jgi:hypothetical protein
MRNIGRLAVFVLFASLGCANHPHSAHFCGDGSMSRERPDGTYEDSVGWEPPEETRPALEAQLPADRSDTCWFLLGKDEAIAIYVSPDGRALSYTFHLQEGAWVREPQERAIITVH